VVEQASFIRDAEATAALLRRQFQVVVDPRGRLIHARRRTVDSASITSHQSDDVFAHCRPTAQLGTRHDRLETLLRARAGLELTRLVVQQVRHTPHKLPR